MQHAGVQGVFFTEALAEFLYNITLLACTCGNSTACVCYLNWKHVRCPFSPPPPPLPNRQMDGRRRSLG